MSIQGKTVLVLGGAGLVGTAVCRKLVAERVTRLVVAARREDRARAAVERLQREHPAAPVEILAASGDVFLRAEWQADGSASRAEVLADPIRRRRLVDDVLAPLDEEIIAASFLVQLIGGEAPGARGAPADIVIDCMNTATAVSYQSIYAAAERIRGVANDGARDTDWPAEVDSLLAALDLPQLVRHVQLLSEGLRRAATQAYVKVGTTGSGGYGFNIPYTHGEERPSRLLLGKSAVAGAQALLTFLMARTPGAPALIRHVTPAACIGWRKIGHGPIRRHGRSFERVDCEAEDAVPIGDPRSLVAEGNFGERIGQPLEGVYIDTGENGVFSADEFLAITAPGQMQLVTAEEIASSVVRELRGASTGHDVVAALDASVMGPSARGSHLREAAIARLRQLEAEHGAAIAFEILGPPRLSKLLFEAHLLERACGTVAGALAVGAEELAHRLEAEVMSDRDLRQRILSIDLPIALSDGKRLLRGPRIKAGRAEDGWVDLRIANMGQWQRRLRAIEEALERELDGDTSSRHDRAFGASARWQRCDRLVPGEVAAWIFTHEDKGRRHKA